MLHKLPIEILEYVASFLTLSHYIALRTSFRKGISLGIVNNKFRPLLRLEAYSQQIKDTREFPIEELGTLIRLDLKSTKITYKTLKLLYKTRSDQLQNIFSNQSYFSLVSNDPDFAHCAVLIKNLSLLKHMVNECYLWEESYLDVLYEASKLSIDYVNCLLQISKFRIFDPVPTIIEVSSFNGNFTVSDYFMTNLTDEKISSYLMGIVKSGNLPKVKEFLAKYVHIEEYIHKAVFHAADLGFVDVLVELLNHTEAADILEYAFYISCKRGHTSIINKFQRLM